MKLPDDLKYFDEELAARIANALGAWECSAAGQTLIQLKKLRDQGHKVKLAHSEKIKAYAIIEADDDY